MNNYDHLSLRNHHPAPLMSNQFVIAMGVHRSIRFFFIKKKLNEFCRFTKSKNQIKLYKVGFSDFGFSRFFRVFRFIDFFFQFFTTLQYLKKRSNTFSLTCVITKL